MCVCNRGFTGDGFMCKPTIDLATSAPVPPPSTAPTSAAPIHTEAPTAIELGWTGSGTPSVAHTWVANYKHTVFFK